MIYMKIFRALTFLSLFLTSGCGWLLGDEGFFRDKSGDYKTTPEFDVMEIPSGKEFSDFSENYPVAKVSDTLTSLSSSDAPRPMPMTVNVGEDIVRIQKLADEQWALIEASPGKLWPKVRAFLIAANLSLSRIDARLGIMETDWLKIQDQELLSRFQFRIDRGVQRESSELHILQMNRSNDESIWPKKSDDLSQETQMLKDIAQYIANSSETDSVSMIADSSISSLGRITLNEDSNGQFSLSLTLPFNRSWASVERALERSLFEITDRNRSQGTYYVTYIGPKNEDEGWFDWLWGEEKEHPLAGKKFFLNVQTVSGDEVKISILRTEEDPEFDGRQEQALLSLLKGNIT